MAAPTLRLRLLPALLLLAATLLASPASAAAFACVVPAGGAGPALNTFYAVVGSTGQVMPDLTGSCASGAILVDPTPSCPTPPLVAPLALPGQLCGLYVAPGASITCEWIAGAGSTTWAVYVGLDFLPAQLGEGNTGLPFLGEVVYGPIGPGAAGAATITNPGPAPARWIAYPAAAGLPNDINFVNCV